MNAYNVIIIGTGAGGGTLAYRLAPSGKRILLIERGDYVSREKDNWSSKAVNVEAKYHTKEVWRDKDGKPLHPHTNYYVGGNTKFYGAALFRLRERDFGELVHHGGISPAWPISYDEIEPYYTEAEHLYNVHGERGVDPTEPWTSAPYPFPAVQHEPRIQQLHDGLARNGLRPFHVPLGIMCSTRTILRRANASAARRATGSRAWSRQRATRRSCASIQRSNIRM
jgi:choline dehydrogenase-like flavoprotein